MKPLDFIVIGVQKGGTTSLWQHLRRHPGIFMPRTKEAPFFNRPDASQADFDAYMRRRFAEAPDGALLGKATPHYTMGSARLDVAAIASRIAATVAAVRLVVLLRDPVERAFSQYRMAVRRGQESRSFERAIEDQLAPASLAEARRRSNETNSYVVRGEYGRILGIYRDLFPAEQLHVELTAELERRPGETVDRVLSFLGLPPGFRPEGIGVRHFQGGARRRIDEDAEAALIEFVRRDVMPHLDGDMAVHGSAIGFFYETWNVLPEEQRPELSEPTRRRLEQHFQADAEQLQALGVAAPWAAERCA